MIAVAIIGILLSIAIPSYKDYMIRGARSAAQTYLSDLAQRQELIFQDARAYSSSTSDFPTMPADITSRYQDPNICSNTSAPGVPATYSITLKPIVGGMMKNDGDLVVDSKGSRKRIGYDDW
ncbi:MAG: hypothetical protein IPJ38_00445 [Dechloromonas sp.]|uniref:Uncharacterized protein n=1 Tax=Candidatus Dechloromonas phosphorivorans TaxID=2899244 RepID=A0A935MUK8_9RHOO|nr:hypothetical protein [Candidatus Dechloromonas phosphorivorans]